MLSRCAEEQFLLREARKLGSHLITKLASSCSRQFVLLYGCLSTTPQYFKDNHIQWTNDRDTIRRGSPRWGEQPPRQKRKTTSLEQWPKVVFLPVHSHLMRWVPSLALGVQGEGGRPCPHSRSGRCMQLQATAGTQPQLAFQGQ